MFASLLQHRHLTWEMAKREFQDRFVGHLLGWFWAVAQPALFMGIQILVFSQVFRVSLAGYPRMPFDYVSYVLAGLLPWFYVQELLSKSCSAVSGQASLVKQVVFPVEVLPMKTVLATLFPQFIALGLFAVYTLISFRVLPWTYVFVPVVVLFQTLLMCGCAFIISAAGVYVRDIREVIQTILLAALYMLPVFYLPDMVPRAFQWLLWLNPFTYMVWCFQDVLYFGSFTHPVAWVVFPLESVFACWVGLRFFRKVKGMFGSQL